MKQVLGILMTVILCLPNVVGAQDIPPGEDRIVVVREGQSAPYSGHLFDTDTAMRWGYRLQELRTQLRLTNTYWEQREVAVRETHAREIETLTRSWATQEAGLRQDLRDQSSRYETRIRELSGDPPWYRTMTFGLILGFVGTLVLLGLSIYGLDTVAGG